MFVTNNMECYFCFCCCCEVLCPTLKETRNALGAHSFRRVASVFGTPRKFKSNPPFDDCIL